MKNLNTNESIILDDNEKLPYLQLRSCLNYFKFKVENKYCFYKNVCLYQEQAEFDQNQFSKIQNQVRVNFENLLTSTKKIYATFHIGSYRLLSLLLIENNIDFALVINEKTLASDKSKYEKITSELFEKLGVKRKLQIINAESKSGIIQMIRAVKANKSLIFYVDGNTGVGGFTRKDDKLIEVTFLKTKILSRKGIAFLSQYLNIPIAPVLSWRDGKNNSRINLKLFDEISPTQYRKDQYIIKATQKLWNLFENKLIKYPEQWEGWLYAHHFGTPEKRKEVKIKLEAEYTFNHEYDFFVKNKNYYLYDLLTFETIKISDKLYKVLKKVSHFEIVLTYHEYVDNFINREILDSLIRKNILIKVNI